MIDVFPANPLPDPLYPPEPFSTSSDGGGSGQTTPPPPPPKPKDPIE